MYLKLYVEDFKKLSDWEAVCKSAGVSTASSEITVYYSKVEGK